MAATKQELEVITRYLSDKEEGYSYKAQRNLRLSKQPFVAKNQVDVTE